LDRNSSSIRERPVARGTGPKRSSLEEVRVSLTQGPRCNAFALRRSYDDEGKKALGRWRTQKYENYGSLSEITDCAPESTELSKIGKIRNYPYSEHLRSQDAKAPRRRK